MSRSHRSVDAERRSLDQETPVHLHAGLIWRIDVLLDRWLASRRSKTEEGTALTRLFLTRMLSAR